MNVRRSAKFIGGPSFESKGYIIYNSSGSIGTTQNLVTYHLLITSKMINEQQLCCLDLKTFFPQTTSIHLRKLLITFM